MDLREVGEAILRKALTPHCHHRNDSARGVTPKFLLRLIRNDCGGQSHCQTVSINQTEADSLVVYGATDATRKMSHDVMTQSRDDRRTCSTAVAVLVQAMGASLFTSLAFDGRKNNSCVGSSVPGSDLGTSVSAFPGDANNSRRPSFTCSYRTP